MSRKYLSVVVAAVVALVAVPAAATPGSGVDGPIVARGATADKVKSHSHGPYDVVVQHITIAPGGHTGWHTHPGNAIAVVKSGTLTIYDGDDTSCTGRPISAGQVYLDPGRGHVHIGRNETDKTLKPETLEIVVTYLDVPVGGGVRQDAPSPGNCPF